MAIERRNCRPAAMDREGTGLVAHMLSEMRQVALTGLRSPVQCPPERTGVSFNRNNLASLRASSGNLTRLHGALNPPHKFQTIVRASIEGT